MIRNAILPFAFALSLAAGPALAASEQLRIDDLDLTSEAGKAVLDQRIERVAEQLCTNPAQTGTRIPLRARGTQMKDCLAAVREEVMAKLAKTKLARR